MSEDEIWLANTKFLDRTIAPRDVIKLVTRPRFARAYLYFAKELECLKSKGYRVHLDGTLVLPPQ